ncbi:MAG: dipeptidyl aminopeptidase/acylaminoacyl peptidase [Verrucomicrobiales bacterium]|jgi:dipeptidyl aminopeptidase/acylaminoacyl peptidase
MKLEDTKTINLPAHCLTMDQSETGELFVACYDGSIHRIDPATGATTELAKLPNIASGVNWCAAAGRLVAADYDGTLHWIDPAAKAIERSYKAHGFWSWQSARSADGKLLASATGQYRVGGYKYEPAGEREPSVKVLDAKSGDTLHEFEHVPPVQSVAFSPDGSHLAAGNLMGEVRIWELETGKEAARIETPSFTGWGIIKGHYYTGGVFALQFAPDGESVYLAGMGTTRDPAAGNGAQLWEQWSWRNGKIEKLAAARGDEIGQGLMETLAFRPGGEHFTMAGRLFKGNWNIAVFDAAEGGRLAQANTNMRVSKALWSTDGKLLFLAGGGSQPKSMKDYDEGKPWGKLKILEVS